MGVYEMMFFLFEFYDYNNVILEIYFGLGGIEV